MLAIHGFLMYIPTVRGFNPQILGIERTSKNNVSFTK